MWGKVNSEQQYLANLGITPTHVGKSRRWRGKQDGGWDHPHPCGEKGSRSYCEVGCGGSPPPMWGKVSLKFHFSSSPRITPTHVGKRKSWASKKDSLKDHPHPCGEKKRINRKMSLISGSPPPMWGKALQKSLNLCTGGITPTHVGKSASRAMTMYLMWDHPHPCGEKTK